MLVDNRFDFDDSRDQLSDSGGGMMPIDDIVGKVVLHYIVLKCVK